jgi:WXXGXW repeat (2 copies)
VKIAPTGFVGLAAVLGLCLTGCNRTQNAGPDPAAANMAPGSQTEPVARNEAPVVNGRYEEQLTTAPAPPPPLPEYSQPSCPGENYMWTPGYWAYSSDGYYWTPGAWVVSPYVGALWTPPWWGYSGGNYIWHAGYWGPYVGFYGGIDYGFGYTGRGFYGGYWQGAVFNYNRTVMNVNTTVVRNVYERRVSNYTPVNRISYNGGNGGIDLRSNASEEVALRTRRMGAAPTQIQNQREAAANREQFAAVNHGRPSVVAARPAPERQAAMPPQRGGAESEPSRREVPTVNARPEPRGGPETRAVQRPEAPPLRAEPTQTRLAPAAPRPEVQPNRPAVAARPSMPESRPSPFQPPSGRPSAPQFHQERSADRRMPERTPQPPAARQGQPEARPAAHQAPESRPPAQAERPAPQGRQAPAARPEPQRQDRDKHSK